MNKKIILSITLSLCYSFMNISASVPSDSDVVTAINQGNTSKLTELFYKFSQLQVPSSLKIIFLLPTFI